MFRAVKPINLSPNLLSEITTTGGFADPRLFARGRLCSVTSAA
jgi:hypothetical protein